MIRVLGLRNDALVYFVRCDLRPSGRRTHGPGRGAGPQARGARAAPPRRPPAAGPQPWARRGGAAGDSGPRVPHASTFGAGKPGCGDGGG